MRERVGEFAEVGGPLLGGGEHQDRAKALVAVGFPEEALTVESDVLGELLAEGAVPALHVGADDFDVEGEPARVAGHCQREGAVGDHRPGPVAARAAGELSPEEGLVLGVLDAQVSARAAGDLQSDEQVGDGEVVLDRAEAGGGLADAVRHVLDVQAELLRDDTGAALGQGVGRGVEAARRLVDAVQEARLVVAVEEAVLPELAESALAHLDVDPVEEEALQVLSPDVSVLIHRPEDREVPVLEDEARPRQLRADVA